MLLGVILFAWFNACCYGYNFEYTLEERTKDLDGFPALFGKPLGVLAENNQVSMSDVNDSTFEGLIGTLTEFSWFPYIDDYFSKTLKVTRGNITEIRKTKISAIMRNIPKYNLKSFWTKSFNTLLYNVGYNLLNEAVVDMLDTLQDIYGYFKVAIQVEFNLLNIQGSYLLNIYDQMLPLIINLQKNKTMLLSRNFKVRDDQIVALTKKNMVEINEDIAGFVFHSLHKEETLTNSYRDSVASAMQRIQLFKSSVEQWSYTCANSLNTTFAQLSLSDITIACFNTTMENTARGLYDLPANVTLLKQFNMQEISQLGNNTAVNKLESAETLMREALNGILTVQNTAKRPYVVIAREAGITLEKMNGISVGFAVSQLLNMPWELYAKTYNLPTWVSTQIYRFLFREITAADIKELELRILPLQIIFEIFKNPQIPKSLVNQQFDESLLYLSKIPLNKIQFIFELSDLQMNTYSLYKLTSEIFGITVDKFLDTYQITASKFPFYEKARLYDYSSLLIVSEEDVKLFSIIQLIQQTIVDAIYADVMLSSPNQLIVTEYQNVSVRYTLSIPQIAHQYHQGVATYQEFNEYLKKWSNSEDAARILLENNIIDMSRIILESTENTGKMRIIDIVTALLASFGTPCDPEIVHCQKLQECKITNHGARCQCIAGYRFSGPNVCSDLNECIFTKVTCDTNARCINTLGSYNCFCNAGFVGNGQQCLNVNECYNGQHRCDANAVCADTIGSYTCACKEGFEGDGFTCNDTNECSTGAHNCHRNGLCTNTLGSFECSCKSTYEGDGINICRDINECENDTLNKCPKHSICVNSEGSHDCACIGGYYKENDLCHQCLQGVGYCHINAECFQNPFENYCVCKSGFKGNGTDCQDFDECDNANPCLHGECKNHIGSYSCLCDNGFRANDANQVCIDIDECKEASANKITLCNGTEVKCVNVDGTYSCVSTKPNTLAITVLSVGVPLIVILICALFAARMLRRKYQGKKELTTFDKRLNAMYDNKTFEMEDENRSVTPTNIKETESKVEKTTTVFSSKPLRYIFKKEKEVDA